MKKELIRSINAINSATTAAINNLSQRQFLRPTTVQLIEIDLLLIPSVSRR